MDVDRITHAEAARILARTPSTVGRMLADGRLERTYPAPGQRHALSRQAVERVAIALWRRRRHKPGGYWTTSLEAARLLGVTRAHVGALVQTGKLPELRANGGQYLFRRAQLHVIANARRARAEQSGAVGAGSPAI